MLNTEEPNAKIDKVPRIIAMTIGSVYTMMGTWMLLMVKFQAFTMNIGNQKPPADFMNLLNTLHDVLTFHMPFLIVLGLGYLAFGIWLQKLKDKKQPINLLLGLFSLLWAISYTIDSLEYIKMFKTQTPDETPFFRLFFSVTSTMGVTLAFAIFTVPQLIIGKKLWDNRQLEA